MSVLVVTALVYAMAGIGWTPDLSDTSRQMFNIRGGARFDVSTPPPTSTPADSVSEPTVADCGTIRQLGPNPPTDATALQAENCFLAAFQACQPATLTLSSQGVDTGGSTTFAVTLDSNGCHMEGTAETIFVPRRQQTISFACDGVVAQSGGLLVQSCGQYGDIYIAPPAVP